MKMKALFVMDSAEEKDKWNLDPCALSICGHMANMLFLVTSVPCTLAAFLRLYLTSA
jgi:hypothetical protein